MEYFAGLDVSLEETSVCVIDGSGTILHEGKVLSCPEAISSFFAETGLSFSRIGFEAGQLAPWLHRGLRESGLTAICIETRRMKAFASASPVKTDRKDAQLIAQAMRVGLFREVHVKSIESQELRLLLRNRWTLQRKRRDIENEVRGTLKGFGVKLGKLGKGRFGARVRERLMTEHPRLLALFEPMLEARDALLVQEQALDAKVVKTVRADGVCRLLMTTPGIGPVTALAFRSAIDDPSRFARSRDVGVHFGLTPRLYQSGEISRSGRISKCGDAMVRALLFEAALSLLTRTKQWSALKSWGLRVAARRGMRRAIVAVARRLAVILHRMWIDNTEFKWGASEDKIST